MLENRMLIDSEWMSVESYSDEAEMVEDLISLDDDDRDAFESAWGAMKNVDADILKAHAEIIMGRELESAVWDDQYDAIIITYYEEVA